MSSPEAPAALVPLGSEAPEGFGKILALVLDSVSSEHTRRAYERALTDFLGWFSANSEKASKLVANEPHRVATCRIESDLIEMTKRLYYFAKRTARVVAESNRDEEQSEPTM